MKRVTAPLTAMGARFGWTGQEDRLPATLTGGGLSAIEHVQTVGHDEIASSHSVGRTPLCDRGHSSPRAAPVAAP